MPKRLSGYNTAHIALKALKNAHKATFSHSIRTAKVALKIAAKMDPVLYFALHGVPCATPCNVRDAALFHDIGKLFVPVHILEKNGKLTVQERENVSPHPIWGEQILLSSADHRVRKLARFVREHHELPDGSGYPSKLTLDEIAPVSRVINIADRFAALTENRPYRKAVIPEFAIEILRSDINAFFGYEASKLIDVLAGFWAGAAPKQTHDNSTILAPTTAFFHSEFAMAG